MLKLNTNFILRIAFGFFFLMWGIDKVRRTDLWASEDMLGSFYGSPGAISLLVLAVGIVQILVALALFINFKVKIAALVSLAMIASSVVVTIVPMVTYIYKGGSPIPNLLFVDHYPLLAGAWAIYATSE